MGLLSVVRERFGIDVDPDYCRWVEAQISGPDVVAAWSDDCPYYSWLYADVDRVIAKNIWYRKYYQPKNELLAVGECGDGIMLSMDSSVQGSPLFKHHPGSIESIDVTVKNLIAEAERLGTQHFAHDWPVPRGWIVTPGLRVSRINPLWKSLLKPIELSEWRDHVQTDSTLNLEEFIVKTDPFKGIPREFPRPGRSIWDNESDSIPINYCDGLISVDGQEPAKLQKMREIAVALKASAYDERGRQIDT